MSWSSEDSPGISKHHPDHPDHPDSAGTGHSHRSSSGSLAGLVLAAGVALALGVGACGHAPAISGVSDAFTHELVLSYDDNRPSGQLAFPNLTYESLVRFELPAGKHRALRLRALVSAAGSIEISLYANSPLEAPGDLLERFTWTVEPADASSGKDGRWLVSDLRDLQALDGIIWVGLRKTGGEPTVWTSSANSGQTFLRDRRSGDTMGILPVKRTPMVRLELLL
jgi:hypothetical protein